MSPTWSVVTLTRNTRAEFCRYVSWYLELGADRIHLYFHDPDDPNIALVEADERIVVRRLTEALSTELGICNEGLSKVQDAIGRHAYSRLDTDWALRVDIDELLHVPGHSVPEMLSNVPDDVLTALIYMAEHLPGGARPDEYRFRTMMTDEALDRVYGAKADLVRSRMGLIGHRQGKSVSRSGVEGFELFTHSGRYPDRKRLVKRPRITDQFGVYLLHFNGTDFDTWNRTLEYRIKYSSFDPVLSKTLREILGSRPERRSELREIFIRLNEFDEERFYMLKELGCGFSLKIDFDALIDRHFPGLTMDA